MGRDVGNTWAAQHSPFRLSCLSCLLGEFRRWELDKKVPGFTDQRLIRKVLWDLGQEVVDRGHVTLAVQNFLFPVQHDLQRSERRTDKKWGQLLGTCWHLFQSQKKKTLYFQLKDLLQEETLQ